MCILSCLPDACIGSSDFTKCVRNTESLACSGLPSAVVRSGMLEWKLQKIYIADDDTRYYHPSGAHNHHSAHCRPTINGARYVGNVSVVALDTIPCLKYHVFLVQLEALALCQLHGFRLRYIMHKTILSISWTTENKFPLCLSDAIIQSVSQNDLQTRVPRGEVNEWHGYKDIIDKEKEGNYYTKWECSAQIYHVMT